MTGNHLFDVLSPKGSAAEDRVFAFLPDGRQASYGDFFSGAACMAGALRDNGLAPGDRVAAQVAKSIEALQLYLGTVMAGGVFLPLNPAYTPNELKHFVEDAEPAILVADPGAAAAVGALSSAPCLTLDGSGRGSLTDATAAAQALDPRPRAADDLAAILYTSGTTGRPKGAMLSHANLASNAETLAAFWRFSSDDVLIHALPIFHTHGLFVATNIALVSGAALRFHAAFDPARVIEDMPRASSLMGVPTFYTRLLEQPTLAEAARDMRLFVSGSAPLLADTHRQWQAVTGHRILERYGMTETNMNTSNPYDGERRAGTVGPPLPGVDLRLTDGKGTPVADGGRGIVEVRGPNVFQGYWRLPEKTAEELLPDGFFVTGDIGELDADGYLQIVGRAKDLVISGGFNVYPKEVEQVIDAVPGVLESAVIGVPHPDFGEAVVAVVVAEAGHRVTPDAVSDAIRKDLARYKQPKHVALREALPRNTMGKVQKTVLRAEFSALFTG